MLKNSKVAGVKLKEENSLETIITDLNTQFNATSSRRQRKLIQIMTNLAEMKLEGNGQKCDCCEETFTEKPSLESHKASDHEGATNLNETQNIFVSHHEEEEDDTEIELDSSIWNILFSHNGEEELNDVEKKEVLKLHRYFAHRSGKKLWQNLFQPAGRFKGKKKMVLQYLEKCEVCRTRKRTPSRPKVGLPKAKDVNDVVSIDLKIMKKTGKSEIGILYLHDEFSKLIKGHVINDIKERHNNQRHCKQVDNRWGCWTRPSY